MESRIRRIPSEEEIITLREALSRREELSYQLVAYIAETSLHRVIETTKRSRRVQQHLDSPVDYRRTSETRERVHAFSRGQQIQINSAASDQEEGRVTTILHPTRTHPHDSEIYIKKYIQVPESGFDSMKVFFA